MGVTAVVSRVGRFLIAALFDANVFPTVDLKNLSLYQPVPEGKAVIAWLFDKTEPRYEDNSPDITFTIRAQVVEKSPTDGGNDTADQKTGTETDATKKQTAAEEGTSKDEL